MSGVGLENVSRSLYVILKTEMFLGFMPRMKGSLPCNASNLSTIEPSAL